MRILKRGWSRDPITANRRMEREFHKNREATLGDTYEENGKHHWYIADDSVYNDSALARAYIAPDDAELFGSEAGNIARDRAREDKAS